MNRLKKLREQRGMTQKEVADHLGVDLSYVSKIEKSHRDLPGYFVEPLKRILRLDSTAELFIDPDEEIAG